MIDNQKLISVLNYNENTVIIPTREGSISFAPAEDNVPTSTPLTIGEIEYANSNSVAFKSGMLGFEEDIQEGVYERLRINDWKNIISNSEIEDIILNPTMVGLQKIIDVKSPAIFSRIRGLFTKLKNSGTHDISIRVENVIKARYSEFLRKQYKTNILLTQKDTEPQIAPAKKVEELEIQLAEMKKMMAQMLASQKNQIVEPKPDVEPSAEPTEPRAGRYSKSKKQE